MATGGWFSSLLGRDRSEARDQMVRESLENDDDWCDVPHGEQEGDGCEQSMDGASGKRGTVALKSTEDHKNNSVALNDAADRYPSKPLPSYSAAVAHNSQCPHSSVSPFRRVSHTSKSPTRTLSSAYALSISNLAPPTPPLA